MFVNVDERYGGQEEMVIWQYQDLSPLGVFHIRYGGDGDRIVEEMEDGTEVIVAEWHNEPVQVAPPVLPHRRRIMTLGAFPNSSRNYVVLFRSDGCGRGIAIRSYHPGRVNLMRLSEAVNALLYTPRTHLAALPDGWVFTRW